MSKDIISTRIARVSTVPLFIFTLLRTQVEAIRDSGAAVTIITSPDAGLKGFKPIERCEFKTLAIAREIKPFADLHSLLKLFKLFRKQRFTIVHSNTPKAGLLCAIAGKMAGVPIRLHTFTGQPWATIGGLKRSMLKFFDRLIATLNTYCYADSESQKAFLIENKIIKANKISVLGSGSLSGVDITRFDEGRFSPQQKQEIRVSLGIKEDEMVLLFLGRITKEKGVFELIDAFSRLLVSHSKITLLMAGPFEQGIEAEIRAYGEKQCGNKIIFSGFCAEPEQLIAISDVLCLPSYREGFGTVVIEAAAMSVPAVGSRIYGLQDAIVHEETGLLVESKNVEDLAVGLNRLISDDSFRLRLGRNAKLRAVTEFDSQQFGLLMVQEYEKLLSKNSFKN
ncbi:glycosyltransferase [Legionella jordanis]|uniref:Glycosyl transferase, group 1 n=1 Tax=Legionella jordanis TaxID=456 RepID=A0A0W0VFR4_9GAMM|nr:glycosyltransferase [Legionella jordanis]KTD18951.1 glycosyl transferase, group 1 [Legionella jordanis]RMX05486.1 glycosyltransferase family 1 protein [Legionella jordanis]RMX19171.1 glycosyltransferase family 1 protein [Legionella jordanis]VEH13051.1 glycosyl transferase, group 1 [Legionella jordanis]